MNLRSETIIFVIISALAILGAHILIYQGVSLPVPTAPVVDVTTIETPAESPEETSEASTPEVPIADPIAITSVYDVVEGDDLAGVSEKFYGTPHYAPAIVWASSLVAENENNPEYSINTENLDLRESQKLSIPTVAEIETWQAEIDRAADVNREIEELSISELQAMMASGEISSVEIVQMYIGRVNALDSAGPMLNSVIEINPDALEIAAALDAERLTSGPRGPLHGIPVLLKDNIDTNDRMQTTAGSYALLGSKPSQDASVVQGLREAGAVIFGKANLSEWANYRDNSSISGWSGRGGFTRNPYRLDFTPWGSSAGSGVAVAANLVAVALGTETAGSITAPSVINGIVGFKPTVGLTSRAGVVPIAHSYDTVGPMTRTVADAAAVLGAITGPDSRDPLTHESRGKHYDDYTRFLDPNGLDGARIGVPLDLMGELDADVERLFNDALAVMESKGAVIQRFEETPGREALFAYDGTSVLSILSYEFHDDIEAYLENRVADPNVRNPRVPRSIIDLIEINQDLANRELQFFGQSLFEHTAMKGEVTEAQYLEGLNTYRRLSGEEGIKELMREHNLDVLVLPTNESFARIYAALAGYPLFTVPGGFTDNGLPWGLGFLSYEYTEPTLVKLSYAYEQATQHRRPPTFSLTLLED